MGLKSIKKAAAAAGILVISAAFVLELTVFNMLKAAEAPLPTLLGNFESNRERLPDPESNEEFTFAVVGDTMSIGTFERLSEKLRGLDLNLTFLLGDCSYAGSPAGHRLLRAESSEVALPCPTFYVVGNHDVTPDQFNIAQFEATYGPTLFSFEYRNSLFIVLRTLDKRFDNGETLRFLGQFTPEQMASYDHTFAFMHIPPPITADGLGRKMTFSEEIMNKIEGLGIDWVFTGDYHGYVRVERGDVNYIVTGGGGGHLEGNDVEPFHHAVIVKVMDGRVEERILPVERNYDIEDALEKVAYLYLGPYACQNKLVLAAANAGALAALGGLAMYLRSSRGKDGLSKSST